MPFYPFNIFCFYFQASINDRDLRKETRRAPKGAAAQLAAQKRRAEQEQAQAREATKKIKLELISDEQFFKKLAENNNFSNFSNELKHHILGLNNNNFLV